MTTGMEGRRAQPRPASQLASRLVGRDVEVGALHDALGHAAGGQGGVAFVVGEPGIGKSRLAQKAAADAEDREMRVLRGRAVPTASPLAYRPLAEALCSVVRAGAASDAPELRPFRPMLGWLVPEWRESDTRVEDSVMALAEAILRFLRVVAGNRGCLVVLEDLHWADPETLTIVEYLADNLVSERTLCLVTVRDEERSAGLELARALQARRVSELFRLSRLDQEEVTEMIRSCLTASSVADEVVDLAARAEGVPFLIEELLAVAVTSGALVADGDSWALSNAVGRIVPVTFSDSMRQRLAALGERPRAVLLAAAVLGRSFDWSLLPAITGLAREDVLAALHAAIDTQIVSVDPGQPTFRFRHALTRDAVMGELLPPELVALARRALEAVEATHPELEEGWCELAAELAEQAGDRRRAGELLLEAGRRSLRRGALASGEATLDRARDLLADDGPISLDVDECLTQVLSLAGKRERAVEVGGALLARLGDDVGAAQRRAEVYLRLARAALASTRWDEAHELLERARTETAATLDERFAARVNAVRAQVAIMREPGAAAPLAQAALEAAGRLGLPDVACEALEVLGRAERRLDLKAAEDAFSRALAIAESHHLTLWRARALHELGTIDMLRRAPVGRLEEARNLAVVQGALATAAVVDVQIAAALVFDDDPEPGAVAARRSAGLARRYGLGQTLAAAVALEAYVHARAGRREQMQRCIDKALAQAPGVPDVEVKTSLAAALLAFVEEDRARAHRHLHGAVAPASMGPGGDYSAAPGAGFLALVRHLDGIADDAVEARVAEKSVHFTTRAFLSGTPTPSPPGVPGTPMAPSPSSPRAMRCSATTNGLRHLGRRLVAEAALADAWGDPVPWLRQALAFFDARGEEQIASACRSLLRRAGVAVPRRRGGTDVPGPLTALGVTSRELEVLRLLALGLANKDIGERLYLSPRTVERHVANLAVKTGVGRRSELVAYAARTVAEAPPDRVGPPSP
ncbi:MAG: AAA family ATPase [Actinobacteria bacterium]|nr:AAA family ATPase [Actinomycetota bacterium]